MWRLWFQFDVEHATLINTSRSTLERRVIEHLVEVRSLHVPRHVALAVIVFRENKWLGFFVACTNELNTVLFLKANLVHLMSQTEPFENPKRLRHQRFANVFSGELVPLKQQC